MKSFENAAPAMLWMELRMMKFTRMGKVTSEDTSNVEIEEYNIFDIDSDEEFLAFYDA